MKVLVTGACGFIGSHLVEHLVKFGYKVRAMCQYNSNSSFGWLNDSEYSGEIDFQLGDIRDSEYVLEVSRDVDVIVHLAALIAIPHSYRSPRSYVETNVTGTLNVLEAAKRHGCKIVHTSTSEIYGTPDSVPIDVSFPFKPQSPYAASKAAADHLVKSYVDSFSTSAVIIRPFNTYGPRQSRRAIIPTILSQCLVGNFVEVGNLESVRDFTFVADTARAFELSLKNDGIFDGRTIQLGTGHSLSIKELIGEVSAVTGKVLTVRQVTNRFRPPRSEVDVLVSNPSQALDQLNWTASVPLREGLKATWAWTSDYAPRTTTIASYAQ